MRNNGQNSRAARFLVGPDGRTLELVALLEGEILDTLRPIAERLHQLLASVSEPDIGRGGTGSKPKEKVADRYAADLLIPRFLLREFVRQRRSLDLGMVEDVAEAFGVSRTAAALRLVETEVEPCILIRHSKVEQPWRISSPSVDRRWTPRLRVEPGSHATILHARAGDQPSAERISAEDWFMNEWADQYEVTEQSFRSVEGEVLTLIVIEDEAMLAD